MIFRIVSQPQAPALTVGWLAMTATGRPSTVPVPVTTASADRPSSIVRASSPLLHERPGVEQRLQARADEELALIGDLAVVALAPASQGAGGALFELGDDELLPLGDDLPGGDGDARHLAVDRRLDRDLIFMDSRTSRSWPCSTRWPTDTSRFQTLAAISATRTCSMGVSLLFSSRPEPADVRTFVYGGT